MDTLPERDQHHPIDARPASALNADLLSVEIPVPHTSFEIWGGFFPTGFEAADAHILRGLDQTSTYWQSLPMIMTSA